MSWASASSIAPATTGAELEFGCHLPVFGPAATRSNLLTFAREMERLGYDSLWASDHVVVPYAIASPYPYRATGEFPLPPDSTFLEPLTALAMGAGVGWMREEIELLGAPFHERGAWSDEAIQIMRACWRDERTRFQGRFFNFEDIGCFPKPVRGDIPIWMGGHAKPALRRIVALADGWHAAFPTAHEMEAGITLLKQECADQGRPFEDLTITLRAGLSIRESRGGPDRRALQGTAEQIVGDLRQFKALGVRHVLREARYRDLDDMVQIFRTFARDIRPQVAD